MDLQSELNLQGFELVKLIETELLSHSAPQDELENFIGVTVREIKTPIIEFDEIYQLTDTLGTTISAKKKLNDVEVGLNLDNYEKLQGLANRIIEIEYFNNYTDYSFIEGRIFKWVVDVYENNYAKADLLTYLKTEIESQLNNYQYFFKVSSLGIEKEFQIGDVSFTSITEDFFINEFKKMNPDHKLPESGNIKEMIDEYCSKVIATTYCYATNDKAKKRALYKIELSLSVLKMFMTLESIDSVSLPNLLEMGNPNFNSFISKSKPESFLSFSFTSSKRPSLINNQRFEIFNRLGLREISQFITLNKNDELYNEIINKIFLLGEINATSNFHERCVKIISFYEGFAIPEGNQKGKGEIYVKQIIRKVVGDENLVKILREIYDIRDKYLHNRIEKNIHLGNLNQIQGFGIIFILQLIELNSKYSTKEQALDFFEIRNKLRKK